MKTNMKKLIQLVFFIIAFSNINSSFAQADTLEIKFSYKGRKINSDKLSLFMVSDHKDTIRLDVINENQFIIPDVSSKGLVQLFLIYKKNTFKLPYKNANDFYFLHGEHSINVAYRRRSIFLRKRFVRGLPITWQQYILKINGGKAKAVCFIYTSYDKNNEKKLRNILFLTTYYNHRLYRRTNEFNILMLQE